MAATPSARLHSDKNVSWYIPGPPKLSEAAKDLLCQWSGIDPADNGIEKHVEMIVRLASPKPLQKAMNSAVGGYRFLTLGLQEHPAFDEVVAVLKSGHGSHLFMDLGCCVGQDIRSLANVGVPGTCLIGVDLERAFIEIGQGLFRDKETLGARFVVDDVMSLAANPQTANDASRPLDAFIGRISVLWASALIHLWPLSSQTLLCKNMLTLLKNEPGVRILGRQVGCRIPGEKVHVTNMSGLMYRHNPETFKKMWAKVLGHSGDMDNIGTVQSISHGDWVVSAWFEDDGPSQKQSGSGEDWLTKVARDSENLESSQTVEETPRSIDERASFLVWEVKRTR